MSEQRVKRRRKRAPFLPLFIMAGAVIYLLFNSAELCRKYIYPKNYSGYVEKYSEKYGVEQNLIYAVIKTESGFDPRAESDAGARGLMQLMEDAFDWVKYRMNDDRELRFDNMFEPEYNIEYGTYLLKLLCEEYECTETAVAAYHTGRGNVNKWLTDPEYSTDGRTLENMPSAVTSHYVRKVMTAYEAYNNLY